MERQKNPKLRFSNFADPWKQCRLSNISDVRDGTHDSPAYLDSGHPFVTSKNVKDGSINFDDVQYISDKDFESINKRSKVDVNDILMGMIGTIGNLALIRTEPNFAIKNVALIKDTNQVNYLYLYQYLQSPSIKTQLSSGMDGGTQKFVALKKIRDLKIMVPSRQEQRKIGSFLEKLDNLIALHELKYEEIKALKKVMLQKMFPKEGKITPEIRFPGFTDPWEQRKLGESLSFLKDGTHGTHADATNGPLLLSAKNIKDGTIKWDDSDRRISQEEFEKIHSTFSLKAGDVLLTIVGSIGETAILRDSTGLTFQRSVAFLRPYNSILSEFLYSAIQTQKFQKELESRKSTSAQPGIYLGDLAEIPLSFPVQKEEQEQIGRLFSNLDDTITLHQRKRDELKKLKKGLLQQMLE